MLEEHILQKILFPDSSTALEKLMFCRDFAGQSIIGADCCEIGDGACINFSTYFNAFSCKKWSKYTEVNNLKLILTLQGSAEIVLYHNRILYGIVQKEIVGTYLISEEQKTKKVFEFGQLRLFGTYSFEVHTKDKPFFIYDGYYFTEDEIIPQDVKLAVIFTTYNRHDYIREDIENILKTEGNNIYTYVVDNASNLHLEESSRYTVIPNKNVGGSGGFARGMMQVVDEQEQKHFTHCLIMDDDARISPAVLERLIHFLSFIKEEYKDAFLGGAMFRKDIPYFHVESGASWNKGEIMSYGHGLDMRQEYDCLKNEMEDNAFRRERISRYDEKEDNSYGIMSVEYNAWWFCVIPVSYIRNDNLPLPIFVFHDDVDFGLRSKAEVILLNGLCVWHDAFESKISAMRLYYENRNKLIVNSVHGMKVSADDVAKKLFRDVRTEFCLYRYTNADAIIDGILDFLKGPEWLVNVEAESFNRKQIQRNMKTQTLKELGVDKRFNYDWYRLCCTIEDCDRKHRIVRHLTENGLLLKPDRFIILPFYANRTVQGYRASEILFYDEITEKGYVCKQDKSEIKRIRKKLKKAVKEIRKNYDEAAKAYAEKYEYMISREQWEKYLSKEV